MPHSHSTKTLSICLDSEKIKQTRVFCEGERVHRSSSLRFPYIGFFFRGFLRFYGRKTAKLNAGTGLMDSLWKLPFVLMLLGLGFTHLNAFTIKDDYGHCENTIQKWASSVEIDTKADKHTLRDLLFFLHVPRTGGRTYFHCFLRKLYSSNMQCPRSYDKLRLDPSKPNCRLLVTHDDYSVTSKLPKRKTSVVTILRNPVDRVFSTYEFSIEVAARFLVHTSLKSALQMAARLKLKNKGVSTLDIWPWKYLVPWMREDLFARRDARKNRSLTFVSSKDSYDMEDIVMPLHKYINDPIAKDIVHNGATFQVAGLTNNSYIAESHEVRHCVQKHPTLGHYVLEVAKRRLDEMLYVGLTEDHRESATMFADVVGAQVISQMTPFVSTEKSAADNRSESSLFADSDSENNHYMNSTGYHNASGSVQMEDTDSINGNITVDELMKSYGDCISSLRKTQSRRRTDSLKGISPANFSKEARLRVSEVVLQQIMSLNSLDVELYKHAQDIFSRQHKNVIQKLVSLDGQESSFISSYSAPSWSVVSVALFIVLLLLIILFVNSRRRTLKVKI